MYPQHWGTLLFIIGIFFFSNANFGHSTSPQHKKRKFDHGTSSSSSPNPKEWHTLKASFFTDLIQNPMYTNAEARKEGNSGLPEIDLNWITLNEVQPNVVGIRALQSVIDNGKHEENNNYVPSVGNLAAREAIVKVKLKDFQNV
jgi:hypothetical protein